MSRDKLIAWFWPEESTERARHYLADSVYVLRHALGRDAIVAVGDDLLLNGAVVWTDIAAFREALARGEHALVVELYAGPFFDGVFIDDAPEFERWVELERDRHAREYAQSLEALATTCEGAGETTAAVLWWRRLAEHEPFDSRIAVRLIRALDAAGDRPGAIRHARAYEARFRDEMGGAPSPAVLRELTERLTAQDDGAFQADALGAGAARPASASTVIRRWPAITKPIVWAPAAILLILILVPVGVWWRATLRSPTDRLARGLVVLPFDNLSADSTLDFLGDGITDALIAELGRHEALRVISRTTAMRYKKATRPIPQIARELGVDYVVEGTVLRAGGGMRVTVQLIDASTDRHVWTQRYERTAPEVLALQHEMAQGISRALRLRARALPLTVRRSIDPQAHELYLRGRRARNRSREGLEQAVVFFRQAIDREPSFAAAHAGLADAYILLGSFGFLPARSAFPKGKAAALQAIELDSMSADAYAALGMALTWERDWWSAEDAFLRSISLRPGYATGHQWYGLLLTTLGRMDEALHHAARAAELDPLSLQINNTYGLLLYYAGDSAAALEQYRRIVEAEPDAGWVAESPWLLSNAARIYAANGLYPEAIAALDQTFAVNATHPRPLGELAHVHLRMGQRDDALRAIHGADRTHSQYSYYHASVHAALGQRDSAFKWLALVEDWIPSTMSDLRVDPRLAVLRADPRYGEVLARLGLP